MNDYVNLEKNAVRELACRLCLCKDIVKLKPLSAEAKRKLKQLLDITVRDDDTLPKAICHECQDQLGTLHVFAVKVKKTQKFLDFYQSKFQENKKEPQNDKEQAYPTPEENKKEPQDIKEHTHILNIKPEENKKDCGIKNHTVFVNLTPEENNAEPQSIKKQTDIANRTPEDKPPVVSSSSLTITSSIPSLSISIPVRPVTSTPNIKQGNADKSKKSQDLRVSPRKQLLKRKALLKFKEFMPLEEFAKMEKVDKTLLITKRNDTNTEMLEEYKTKPIPEYSIKHIELPINSPFKNEEMLVKQISLFYKMKCYVCQEEGFEYQSLMSHYKKKHGVPGYVSCCNKKFHYFCPEKIIEHMFEHLRPNTLERCSIPNTLT